MDELFGWIFGVILQSIFFKIGNFIIWLASCGRARFSINKSKPATVFWISAFGFLLTISAIFIAALISQ